MSLLQLGSARFSSFIHSFIHLFIARPRDSVLDKHPAPMSLNFSGCPAANHCRGTQPRLNSSGQWWSHDLHCQLDPTQPEWTSDHSP